MDLSKANKKKQWIRYFENESKYETITASTIYYMILPMLEPINAIIIAYFQFDEFPIITCSLISNRKDIYMYTLLSATTYNGHRHSH